MNLTSINKINTKQKIITSVAIYFVVLFLVFWFFIFFNMKKIKNLRIDILAQKINLEKRINKEKDMSKLSSKIKSMEPEIKRLEKIFVDKSQQMEFITSLEEAAQENKIEQKLSLSQFTAKQDKNYQTSKLQITGSGNIENIISYLKSLESMTYYIDTESISISANSPTSQNTNNLDQAKKLSVSISATTYWK